jgi:branched-chain amino acid transport system permease protein
MELREMEPNRRNRISRSGLTYVSILIFLFLIPFLFKKFIVFVTAYLVINMLLAAATWAIFHQTGQALFAIAVIAGIGGYVSGILSEVIGNTWITMLIAVVVSGGIGMVLYCIGSRVPGHIQFAVLNLTLIWVFNYFIVALAPITKGPDGLSVSYFWPKWLFGDIRYRYWAVLLIASACIFLIKYIMNSRTGKILTLIGRNPVLAETVGINVKKYTILSYLWFSPIIGLGGALYTHFVGYISPVPWSADFSVIIVFCSLIGGTGSILGPLLGAILATGIPILFDATAEFRFGIVGVLAIVIFLVKPDGIVGWIDEMRVKGLRTAGP